MTPIRKYIRGTQKGWLVRTEVAIPRPVRGRPCYVWVKRLALLSPLGRWLYSEYWSISQVKKAHEEILRLGYEEVIDES